MDTLDEMVDQAFDDQCTGANPRYPLLSEIKQMYLNAYYGLEYVETEMPNQHSEVESKDAESTKITYVKAKSKKI